jgi:hypothetical protein
MKENKLIAEFMGLESFKASLASLHKGKINLNVDVYEQAQYHISWDWLMPVVEECRLESRCKYNTDDAWDKIHWALEEVNIEEIYKAVVEFINQLNK